MRKHERKEALDAIAASGKGALDALEDLLNWELEEARQEMESARDDIEIWRSQGRCMGIRYLLAAIKHKGNQ